MDALMLIIVCSVIFLIYVLQYYGYIGFPTTHSLLPFQRGMLFRRGRPVREVGPGRHRVFLGAEKIVYLDTRPIQVSAEHRAVTLADGAVAVFAFTANAKVCDAKKALYSSADYPQIPKFVTHCVTRKLLACRNENQVTAERSALEQEIEGECRSRLMTAGFELISIRLTQLDVAAPNPYAA